MEKLGCLIAILIAILIVVIFFSGILFAKIGFTAIIYVLAIIGFISLLKMIFG